MSKSTTTNTVVSVPSFVSAVAAGDLAARDGAIVTIRHYYKAAEIAEMLLTDRTQRQLAEQSGKSAATINRILKLKSFVSADAACAAFSAWLAADDKRSASWTTWITSVGNEGKGEREAKPFDAARAAATIAKGHSAEEIEALIAALRKEAKALKSA